jgi:HK97 family phage major capsid protein
MQTKSWDDVLASIDAVLAGTFETPEAMAAEVAKLREQIAAMIAEATSAEATAEMVSAAADGAQKAFAKLTQCENAIRAKRQLIDMQTKNAAAMDNYRGSFSVPSGNTVASEVTVSRRPYKGKAFKHYGANAEKAAYRAGASIAALLGDERAKNFCKDNGIEFRRKDQGTDSDTLGGFLVVPELEAAVSYYREERGVGRSMMEARTGSTERFERNRNLGGTNVLPLGEGQTYNTSDVKFDRVGATAKKFGALTKASVEITEDAYVGLAEEIAKDHGYAHAVKEDQCIFLGDGTSTYNGLVGINETFKALVTGAGGTFTNDSHKAYAAGIQVATGATVASITVSDLIKMQSKVATFPGMTNKFYIPSQIWYGQISPLITGVAGNTTTQVVDGLPRTFLNGFEVVFTDELYTPILTAENNAFVAFFGDGTQAGLFYDRLGLSITPSQEAGYLSDELYWKSTARYGLNWWNVGNASSTAANRKRGALAALVTKNS